MRMVSTDCACGSFLGSERAISYTSAGRAIHAIYQDSDLRAVSNVAKH